MHVTSTNCELNENGVIAKTFAILRVLPYKEIEFDKNHNWRFCLVTRWSAMRLLNRRCVKTFDFLQFQGIWAKTHRFWSAVIHVHQPRNNLMILRFLKYNKLFPKSAHNIYICCHSYEKLMKNADLHDFSHLFHFVAKNPPNFALVCILSHFYWIVETI